MGFFPESKFDLLQVIADIKRHGLQIVDQLDYCPSKSKGSLVYDLPVIYIWIFAALNSISLGYRGSAACFIFCFPLLLNGTLVNAALEIKVLLNYFPPPLTVSNNNTLLHDKLLIQVNLLPVIWMGLEKYGWDFLFV